MAASAEQQPITLTFSGSAVGVEGQVFDRQLARFVAAHPGVQVRRHPTPDDADQRHQLYVQWLNARSATPDVLQLDVVWTPEFAAAGWILPLDGYRPEADDFFPQALRADRWQGRLFALPLFVDVGMLYWRSDLLATPPASLAELRDRGLALVRAGRVRHGFVWQGARYEGLVTVFLEHLAAFGGTILDDQGAVRVDAPPAVRALTFMRDAVRDGLVPGAALAWQEEPVRFAFQNGQAAFMRNWPYAHPLVQDPAASRVAGHVAVGPLPAAEGGTPAAALGGARLAINAHSAHPQQAFDLIQFLTAPEQLLERARLAGQFPARRSLYAGAGLAGALSVPPDQARRIIEAAVPRPVTPVYAELSAALQVELHAALSGQREPAAALTAAAGQMRRILLQTQPSPSRARARGDSRLALGVLVAVVLLALGAAALAWRRARHRPSRVQHRHDRPDDERLAWALVAPALAIIALVGLAPLLWTAWESLHHHDLRMPWQGRPFVALDNYQLLLGSSRFWAALGHSALFAVIAVTAEVILGMVLALALHHVVRGRGILRATVLLPWAMPTVVAALMWQFMFADAGIVNVALQRTGVLSGPVAWFSQATLAWVPVVLADVWKTTPFVALLLLAGLQNIDQRLYEAARTDGARPWQAFVHITLPLLKPALLVVLVFRTLDAFRVFDLVYVLTGGGPGTATEPVVLYTFASLLQHLRFGYGSAVSMVVFAIALVLALVYVRLLGGSDEARR
jgi:ABC-type sugar transport system permease subunit/ABC-type glycerol-3-phosphate transport system substrate-binding protein